MQQQLCDCFAEGTLSVQSRRWGEAGRLAVSGTSSSDVDSKNAAVYTLRLQRFHVLVNRSLDCMIRSERCSVLSCCHPDCSFCENHQQSSLSHRSCSDVRLQLPASFVTSGSVRWQKLALLVACLQEKGFPYLSAFPPASRPTKSSDRERVLSFV